MHPRKIHQWSQIVPMLRNEYAQAAEAFFDGLVRPRNKRWTWWPGGVCITSGFQPDLSGKEPMKMKIGDKRFQDWISSDEFSDIPG
ncbi:MAG: hypothetical protein ACYTGF_07050 [Planctomycetota bacterium]|jgi:hypothetical protein